MCIECWNYELRLLWFTGWCWSHIRVPAGSRGWQTKRPRQFLSFSATMHCGDKEEEASHSQGERERGTGDYKITSGVILSALLISIINNLICNQTTVDYYILMNPPLPPLTGGHRSLHACWFTIYRVPQPKLTLALTSSGQVHVRPDVPPSNLPAKCMDTWCIAEHLVCVCVCVWDIWIKMC